MSDHKQKLKKLADYYQNLIDIEFNYHCDRIERGEHPFVPMKNHYDAVSILLTRPDLFSAQYQEHVRHRDNCLHFLEREIANLVYSEILKLNWLLEQFEKFVRQLENDNPIYC